MCNWEHFTILGNLLLSLEKASMAFEGLKDNFQVKDVNIKSQALLV